MPTVCRDRRARRTRRAAGALFVALMIASASADGAFTPAQQKCVNTFNKEVRKVAKAVGKDYGKCLSDRAKSTDANDKLGGLTIAQCFDADRLGKQANAKGKAASKFAGDCAGSANPGVAVTDPTTANDAVTTKEKAVVATMFGSDLDAAVIREADDRDPAKCQQAVAKSMKKCQDTKLNELVKCVQAAMKPTQLPFLGGSTSPAQLASCIHLAWVVDAKAKVAKKCDLEAGAKVDGIRKEIQKKCTDKAVDLSDAFPGCDAGHPRDLHRCLERGLECVTCEAVVEADGFGATGFECDLIDNGVPDASCGPLRRIGAETVLIPSAAQPAGTPGTAGVDANDYPALVARFDGSTSFSLNNAQYTRFFLDPPPAGPPDAILVAVQGFLAGSNGYRILAENLIRRAFDESALVLEVWAFDRRSNQLEDLAGLDLAEVEEDPQIGLDWLFGAELGLSLHPLLAAGPNRRAVFLNTTSDVPFIANWTTLTHSRDIDAVVEAARAAAHNQNVFLGGFSAGTGFAARYAATDLDTLGPGVEPGYAKLRGLVLFEGVGGSTLGPAPTSDDLDRIEDRFDGGLFAAVRDGAPRCVDGTPCTTDAHCVGHGGHETCTPAQPAYSVIPGLLNPRLLAAGELGSIQAIKDPNTGPSILLVDQNGVPGNNAIEQVADLGLLLNFVAPGTARGGLGGFIDDDGVIALFAPFVAASIGAPGPVIDGLQTWQDIRQGSLPASVLPHNGPPPTALSGSLVWGQEVESVRIDRLMYDYEGPTNAYDWYYPASGLSVTNVSVPPPGGSLDTTALSVGRGRTDIENLTQAASIDIPVICFGGSNGLVPVPGLFTALGQSIGPCAAPSCDGITPRVVDPSTPNPAFPTFGGVAGGFEAYINEGYAHRDSVAAEDDASNVTFEKLLAFIERNLEP
jgi:pimeloyl-ACP methyl ester carboxylesterase